MLHKSRAIVLHSLKYRDNSIIAYCYSEAFGRIAFMVNGAFGKGRRPGRAAYFQPFALLDLVFYRKEGAGLCRLKEVAVAATQSTLPFNPVKRSIALFLSEVVYRTVREEEANPALYSFLENAIRLLDMMQQGEANFHLVFLMQLSRQLGFFPANSWSTATKYFDYKNGVFVAAPPQHNFYLSPDVSKLIGNAIDTPFHGVDTLTLGREQRVQAMNGMLRYYRFHLGSSLEFNSLAVLSQIFE